MKHHSEFFEIYATFQALIKTQHSVVIKCFRCDLGEEYTFNKIFQLLALDGTIYQTSCTDTHEQNGVAERKHRRIVETARSLLLSAFVPSEFWGEAVLTAVSLINTIPSSHSSGLSSFEKLYGYVPDYSSFRVFGCTYFVLRPHVERSKLSSRSTICVFLGYGEGKTGYRCFDPITQKLYMSHHVVFLEHIPFFFILSTTHSLTKTDHILIDPFSEDSGNDTSPHVRLICTYNSAVGVIIFGSVRFLPKKYNQTEKKRPETESKPAQTDRFQSGFLSRKPEKPICIFLDFFGFISTVSPRKNYSFSIAAGCIGTTKLSSLIASSTTRRLADFVRSKIAVEKSFLPLFL